MSIVHKSFEGVASGFSSATTKNQARKRGTDQMGWEWGSFGYLENLVGCFR